MEKKNKKELLIIIEEQEKNLQKYKSRLHDIIGSYKNLLSEKETLQNSIKTLTEASNISRTPSEVDADSKENEIPLEQRNNECIENLKSSLGALSAEKYRIENELKADRKKILKQKEDLEKELAEKENKWLLENEKYENQILELRKRISSQQREREKEQQDHSVMLKELQNILSNERVMKEKLEQQVNELLQKIGNRVPEKRVIECEKTLNEFKNELRVYKDNLKDANNEIKRKNFTILKLQEEIENIKIQYETKIEEEKTRADAADEKLGMLVFVKENRIANLENRISELSTMVGDHDKLRQQDQITVQKLKAKISQLQSECSSFTNISTDDSKLWECKQLDDKVQQSKKDSELQCRSSENTSNTENIHINCQTEMSLLRSELEQYKVKCESVLKERYNKTSAALLSDAKAGREIKELKAKIADLQNQLQSCKSQLKLNEEYHSKITSNLEKACEDLKLVHKQEIAEIQLTHKTQLLEFEQQIQKQRERTLLLLEEKDKEIGQLKSTFLSSFMKKEKSTENCVTEDEEASTLNKEAAANILSHSLIASKKDSHILHYVQELARKDVEISNLRQARIQSETALRRIQQTLSAIKEKYFDEVDALQSRIKLLESTQDEEGTNVEYLKNVVLRFLKCNDRSTRKHMINAIATVLHFTNNEIQDIKDYYI